MKTCSRCKTPKSLSEFHKSTKASDGRQGYCKQCVKELARTNPARSAAASKKWYEAGGKDKIRARRILQTYGITVERYEELMTLQSGVCAICKRVSADGSALCVDHDHETGAVRGLLCRECNLMIKSESPSILEAGAYYLRRFGRR